MASSGVSTFRLNRDQIIAQALIKVGALDPENVSSVTASQTTNTANVLNLMVKAWETKGLQLWERKYGVIFTNKGQGVYVLGNPGPFGDHSSLTTNLLGVGGFIQTTLAVAAVAAAGTITLTTITNTGTPGIPDLSIATTFNIGIVLDNGTTQWTTVNGAPAGNVITLSSALTSASAAGNKVYAYQTKLMRPLRVLDALYRQTAGNDIPVRVISREEYNRFGLKTSQGTSIQAYYDPQVNSGTFSFYPVPADSVGQMFIEFQRPIDDFVNSTDDFDLPQEWGEAIVWNLAMRLIPDYRVPEMTANRIERLADKFLKEVTDWDQEQASIYFQPNSWMYETHYHGK